MITNHRKKADSGIDISDNDKMRKSTFPHFACKFKNKKMCDNLCIQKNGCEAH